MKVSTVVSQKYFNGTADKEASQKYRKLIISNFKEVGMVAFGQIKFILQNETNYNWDKIDTLVNFALKNDLRLHYNTVINNKSSFPEWYWKLNPNKKLAFLKNHIETVIGRYQNKFYLYKLVNESIRDNETDFLGTGYSKNDLVSKIFKWAKAITPDSLMMINDFGNFFREDIRKKYVELINNVQKAKGPIDVVGLQGHIWTFELPTDENILKTLNFFYDNTKLPIYITEFDLSYDNTLHGGQKIDPMQPFTTRDGKLFSNWFEYQAFAYRHFFDLCKDSDLVKGFTFWGFCDENVAWERPGIGLFDQKFNPKPAFRSLQDVLRN